MTNTVQQNKKQSYVLTELPEKSSLDTAALLQRIALMHDNMSAMLKNLQDYNTHDEASLLAFIDPVSFHRDEIVNIVRSIQQETRDLVEAFFHAYLQENGEPFNHEAKL